MKRSVVAPLKRLMQGFSLLLLVCLVLVPVRAVAASVEWQSLQGRERLIITKAATEGMVGNIARIDANGIIVPFNQVPSGLVLSEAPKGATIIKGTAQYGQSLAVLTQTPKFGFVVSRQTATQVIIDFFPDELGARWKPGDSAPSLAQLANESLESKAASAPLAEGSAVSSAGGTEPPAKGTRTGVAQSTSTADTGNSPASATPSEKPAELSLPQSAVGGNAGARPGIAWNSQPVSTNPPVLTSDGKKPVSNGSASVPPIPEIAIPEEPQPRPELPEGFFHDTRQDTARRTAALPAPGLDTSLATEGTSPVRSGQTGSRSGVAPQPDPPEGTTDQSQGTVVSGQQTQAVKENSPAHGRQPEVTLPAVPLAQDSAGTDNNLGTGDAPEGDTPKTGDASAVGGKHQPQLLQGVGVKIGPANYRGRYNPYGQEGIAVLPEQSASPQHVPGATASPAADAAAQPEADAPSKAATENVSKPVADSGRVRMAAKSPAATDGATGKHADNPEPADIAVQAVAPENAEQAPSQAVSQPSDGAKKTDSEGVEQATADAALEAPVSVSANDENVIYVNEEGEEVVPPADPATKLAEIRQLIPDKKYAEANDMVTALLGQTNLSKSQREEALHIRAEMLFFLHRDNLAQYGATIAEATDQAINVNPRSPKNAVALLRLGYINLQLENIPEAEARFNLLRRMYPNDENVPLSYYYWGDYFYNHDDLQRAIDQFQVVTQKYPDSKYAREASLGLARAFYRLGYYEQAFNIVEYIEQRWPRFYLNYPPFLNMMGDVAFRLNNFDFAARHYWLYVNLDPQGEEVDVILTRIGDIYSLQQQASAAREVYAEAVDRFPDSYGGLVALMRLAEESINDDPTIANMFDAFDSRPVLRPVDVYKKIINEHPESKLVSLAQLKLAMWHLWNHDYITTLDIADAFLQAKPDDELAPKMKDVALKTFAVLAAESVANGSFSRMRDVWERYPVLQGQEEILTPESRVALAVSYWKDGRPDDALIAVEPFFLGSKVPEYSEMALNLVLNIYEQYGQWAAIEEVGRRVSLWEISKKNQTQLDYALALAREELGKSDEAAILWQKLYDGKQLPDEQMVQAVYFLARDAEKRQKNDEAYLLGVEALKRLQAEAEKNPAVAENEKIKIQISSLMSLTEEGGRLGESLQYADEYLGYLGENDPDRAAVLFRMARINKKQGNEALWRERLNELVNLYPDSVFGQTAKAALKSSDLEKAATAYSPQSR